MLFFFFFLDYYTAVVLFYEWFTGGTHGWRATETNEGCAIKAALIC